MTRWILLAATATALFGAPKFSLTDASGAMHTDAEWKKSSGVVLYFITTDCPVSNGYVPEMNRIAKDYESRGVKFYGVIADTETPLADVRKHAQEFGYTFPILLDPHQVLVKFTNADVTPEAAAVTPQGELKYLGRIDNQVESLSKHRAYATQHDLRDALEAVLAGKPPAKAGGPPVGCYINRVK
ncbi:MAG: redoxin domain-containing protein [Bryobacterales bacterium]|nr:redoxin domain-containing protein [Bryobacterales bacterium]MBV9399771.1 redoxin domain-containing protein [Bryobacterales bacterium]